MGPILLGTLLGAAGSLIATGFWYWRVAPRLELGRPRVFGTWSVGGATGSFWGIDVTMRAPTLAARDPAINLKATVRVWPANQKHSVKEWTCRWAGAPRPLLPTASGVLQFSPAAVPIGERAEVHQHAGDAVDLFAKFDNDRAFYGFLNDSYRFADLKHPSFRFAGTSYLAELTIMYRGRREIALLEIRNAGEARTGFSVDLRNVESLDRFHRDRRDT